MRWVISCLVLGALLLSCTGPQGSGPGVLSWNVSLSSSETQAFLSSLQKELKSRFLSGQLDTRTGHWTLNGHPDKQLDLAQMAKAYKDAPADKRDSAVHDMVDRQMPRGSVESNPVGGVISTIAGHFGN